MTTMKNNQSSEFFECCGLSKESSSKDHHDYHKMEHIENECCDELLVPKKQSILKEIFDEQLSFQMELYDPSKMSSQEKVALSKEYILCAMRELGEVLNVLPWKSHRRYDITAEEVDLEEFGEEIIDVFKFVLNLYIIWGLTDSDFVRIFKAKSEKVRQRLENERQYLKHQ